MKNKNLPLVLLVIVLVIALMAAVYISNASPSYNGVIDVVFSDIAGLFSHEKEDVVSAEEVQTLAEKENTAKKRSQKDEYEITNQGYTLASTGKILWLYDSTWPFVTEPVLYNGTIISVTAEPAFVTLSYETGELLSKQDCFIYPGEYVSVSGNMLTLSGRDRNEYLFRIESDLSFTDMRSVDAADPEEGRFLSLFTPSAKTADFITSRLRTWSADEERTLPELKLYTGHINKEGNGNFWAQKNDAESVLYVFTPDKQGVYQVGLADENGAWIMSNAFVAVFGESGDLKQVSLDYVANKPIIKLHLSDTEIYYIVAGWAKDMYDGTETWLQIAESR